MHPPPSSFIPLHPAHINLYPALYNTLSIIRTNILHLIGYFPQIQTEKFKVVRFGWKVAHMVSWRYWFRNRIYIFEISTPKFIFRSIWVKKSQNCPFCLKVGTHSILEEMILNPELGFRNSIPKSIFGTK